MREAFGRCWPSTRSSRVRRGRRPADAALAAAPGAGATPAEVHAWWTGLTRAQQRAVIAASPGSVGNRDGIPPAARDAANTLALERDLAEWGYLEGRGLLTAEEERWLENARSARDACLAIEQGIDPIDRQSIPSSSTPTTRPPSTGTGPWPCAGDLATADNVAVVVPGFGTDGAGAAYQGERVLSLYEASRTLDGEPDQRLDVLDRVRRPRQRALGRRLGRRRGARRGDGDPRGERLADTIDGLRAARDRAAHLTVIGHSYGSTTLGHGAHDHGLGGRPRARRQPGGRRRHGPRVGPRPRPGRCGPEPTAATRSRTWATTAGGTWSPPGRGGPRRRPGRGRLRRPPVRGRVHDPRGQRRVRGAPGPLEYFDHDTESLYNIAQVVNGRYAAVRQAGHVTDPWYSEPARPGVGPRPDLPGHRRQAMSAPRAGRRGRVGCPRAGAPGRPGGRADDGAALP